jgi:hypothetical protein
MSRWVPWLPLYRVRGQGLYREEGSPNRRVVSLREVLANFGLQAMPSCGARPGVVVIMVLWRHCRHGGGSPAVLCDVVFAVVFVIASWFPGASY